MPGQHASMLGRALLLTLAAGLVASDDSGQLSFSTVPLASEVPAHDVGRYTGCLVSCALHAASAVAPFNGAPAPRACCRLPALAHRSLAASRRRLLLDHAGDHQGRRLPDLQAVLPQVLRPAGACARSRLAPALRAAAGSQTGPCAARSRRASTPTATRPRARVRAAPPERSGSSAAGRWSEAPPASAQALCWTASCRPAPCPACSCSTSGPWTARSMPRWARARPRLVPLGGVLVAVARVLPGRPPAWVQAAGRPAPPAHGARRAQPLYAPGVKFADHTYRNLVIIATEFNSVFAFDAGAPCVHGLLLCTAAPLHVARHGCTLAHAARSPRRHARAGVEQVADHWAGGHGRRHPRGAQPPRRPLHGHRAILWRAGLPAPTPQRRGPS
jgi:hypothetical protein